MGTTLTFEQYRLDVGQLYSRMWSIAADDLGDGTRLFRPRPGGRRHSSGLSKTSPARRQTPRGLHVPNALRQQVHRALTTLGWAERINQMSFRLLRNPETEAASSDVEDLAARADKDLETTDGVAIADVPVENVTAGGDRLGLADLTWSSWRPIDAAAREATTDPGVYVARSDGQIVYVGMAGERRGQGVRGRLQIYARGRGAVSGLGEAALDRALADPAWLAQRLASLHADGPARTKEWASDAIRRAQLELCWAAAPDAETCQSHVPPRSPGLPGDSKRPSATQASDAQVVGG